MTNEEKALACYDVVRRGMFQYPMPYDVQERREEWHDPVKLLNVYGHGLCGCQSRVLGSIYQEVFGYDNQRLTGLGEREIGDWEMGRECGAFFYSLKQKNHSLENRQGHSTIEAFYDDAWHHLDPMVEYYTYSRDGSRIAGLEECLNDWSLVEQPSRLIDGLCPDGDISVIYTKSNLPTTWTPGPGYYIARGTSMEIDLVPGRRVTWLWDKLDGMFIWPDVIRERFAGDHFDAGPRHPDPEKGAWRHYGNGILSQRLDTVTPDGVRIDFPYPFVDGRVLFTASREGQVVHFRSDGARCDSDASVERVEGAFETVEGANDVRLGDIVREGYGLEVRPAGGAIQDVAIELYFQHNFIMRPRLLPGANQVTVSGEGDSEIQVDWKWEQADGGREDRRVVGVGDSYGVEVGAVAASPEENPKYMKSLTVELAGDGGKGAT